jgi:hypothetical protein
MQINAQNVHINVCERLGTVKDDKIERLENIRDNLKEQIESLKSMPDAFDSDGLMHVEQLLQLKAMSMAQDRQIEIRDAQIRALMRQIKQLRNSKS